MIVSFANEGTEDIHHGKDTKSARKALAKALWPVAQRKLDALDVALTIRDLTAPPSNRLEKLAGNLSGRYSIRVNEQFRDVFRFENGNASEVQIVDYH